MIKNHLSVKELDCVFKLDTDAHNEIQWWEKTKKSEFKKLNKEGHTFLIASTNKPVGFILVKEDKRRKTRTVCLEALFITKSARNKGHGKLAVKSLIVLLTKDRVKVIKISAPTQLQGFYESAGFKTKYIALEQIF